MIHTVKGFSVVNETEVDIHYYDFQYKIQKSVLLKPKYLIYRFFFKFLFILLYNTILVLPYINVNLPRVYTCELKEWV